MLRKKAGHKKLGGIDKIPPEALRGMPEEQKRANRRMWRAARAAARRQGPSDALAKPTGSLGGHVTVDRDIEADFALRTAWLFDLVLSPSVLDGTAVWRLRRGRNAGGAAFASPDAWRRRMCAGRRPRSGPGAAPERPRSGPGAAPERPRSGPGAAPERPRTQGGACARAGRAGPGTASRQNGNW